MPTPTNYTFSVSTAFTGGVNPERLDLEIRASSIVTVLDGITVTGDDCVVTFRDALSPADVATMNGLVSAHTGAALPETPNLVRILNAQPNGAVQVAPAVRQGKEVIYSTPNMTRPTSWYSESARVTNKTLTQNGSVWETGDGPLIDLTHGEIFDEEGVIEDQTILGPANPHGYVFGPLTVDGVTKTARAPFAAAGGDYTINYGAGTVTPVSEDWTGQTVVASYSKKTGDGWILEPLPGKALFIEQAKITISSDLSYDGTFQLEVLGYAAIFAPQLGLPPGTRIPIAMPTLYKTARQMLIETVVTHYPIMPVQSTAGRGIANQLYQYVFRYGTVRTLFSCLGMQVRISVVDGVFTGEVAQATFYCTSSADPGIDAAIAELSG